MLLDWRLWLKVGLYAAIFDGALRKWVLPGAANVLYFLKDIIFVFAYILFLIKNGRQSIMPAELRFMRPVLTFVALIIAIQGFNPRLGSIAAGFMGIRNYLIYAPLVVLVPKMFRSKEQLQNFLWTYGLTMIPVGILGVMQFLSPPSARINIYVGDVDSQYITSFGQGKTRITGPFSYISGYGTYLTFIFGILLTLITRIDGSKWRKILLFGSLGLCISNMLMTGSRMPVFSAILMIVFYVAVQAVYSQRQFRKMLPSMVIAGVVFVVAMLQSPAYKSFVERLNSSRTEEDSRLDPTAHFENFFNVMRYEDYIGGWGVGAYHPATMALRSTLGLPVGEPLIALEEETDRVLAELGSIGFVLWYGLRAGFLLLLWIVFLQMRDPSLRSIALSALALHLLMLPGQLVFQHTAGVYYWFLAGFGVLLPRLQLAQDARAEEEALLQEEYEQGYEDELLPASGGRG